MRFIFLLLALTAPPAPEDLDLATEWTVTVTENDIARSLHQIDPQDLRFSFPVDQQLAPGWTCDVYPEAWRGTNRSRWLTCQNGGRAKVSIRTSCRSNRQNARSQEMWLGDKVSIELSCRSGELP